MKKVLLVNDSKFESMVMKDMLNSIGYEVKMTDEYQALNAVTDYKPQYVIVNYTMKEIRGDKLVGLLESQKSKAKFLLSSNNSIRLDEHNRKIEDVIITPAKKSDIEETFKRIEAREKAAIQKTLPMGSQNKLKDIAQEMAYCPSCKHILNVVSGQGFTFCPYCGTRL